MCLITRKGAEKLCLSNFPIKFGFDKGITNYLYNPLDS